MYPQGTAVDRFETVEDHEQHQHVGQRTAQRGQEPVDVGELRDDRQECNADRQRDRHLHDQRPLARSPGDPQRRRRHRAPPRPTPRRPVSSIGRARRSASPCSRTQPLPPTISRRRRSLSRSRPPGREASPRAAGSRCVAAGSEPSRWRRASALCLRCDRRPTRRCLVVDDRMHRSVRCAHRHRMAVAECFVERPPKRAASAPLPAGASRSTIHRSSAVVRRSCTISSSVRSDDAQCTEFVESPCRHGRMPSISPTWLPRCASLAPSVVASRRSTVTDGPWATGATCERVDRDLGGTSPPDQPGRTCDLDTHGERDRSGPAWRNGPRSRRADRWRCCRGHRRVRRRR